MRKAKLLHVLVDISTLVDILYWDAFKNLLMKEEDPEPNHSPIKGFRQTKVLVTRKISLPMTLGSRAQTTTTQIDFTVVRFTFRYNAILGRSTLNVFHVESSTYHQCLKLPSNTGICCIRGSQQVAQSC